jgi:hypothetical protein
MSGRGVQNAIRRTKNLPEIISFCHDMGLKYVWIAGNWHMRIEGKLDVYPTRKRATTGCRRGSGGASQTTTSSGGCSRNWWDPYDQDV